MILKSAHRGSRLGHKVVVVAVLLVLVGLGQSLVRNLEFLSLEIPVLRLWPDAPAQVRSQVGSDLYDTFEAADSLVPSTASILFVTPGLDPRHTEYTAFHRALYHLAPRPIWWANPSSHDGTWESRWWIQVANTSDALAATARDKSAAYVIFYGSQVPSGFGEQRVLTPMASLVSLAGEPAVAQKQVEQRFLGAPWQFISLAIGLFLVFAAGYLVIRAARPLGYVTGPLETASLAWPMGSGVVSVGMFLLNALALKLDGQILVLSGLVILGIVWLGVLRLRALVPS